MHKEKKKITRDILFKILVYYLTLIEEANETIIHPVNLTETCTEWNTIAICFEFIDVENLWTNFLRQFLVIYSYLLLYSLPKNIFKYGND